jgi:hypothetical protein
MLSVGIDTSLDTKLGPYLLKLILSFDFKGCDSRFCVSLLLTSKIFYKVVQSLPNTTWVKKCLRRRYVALKSSADLPSIKQWYGFYNLLQEDQDHLESIGYTGEGKNIFMSSDATRGLILNDFYAKSYGFPFNKEWDELIDKFEQHGYKCHFFSYPSLDIGNNLKHYKEGQHVGFHRDSSVWVTWNIKNNNKNKKRKC